MEGVPESLQDRLEEYNRNFEATAKIMGANNTLDKSATAELQIEQTREMLIAALPVAVKTMVGVAAYGVSETNKRLAAQYLIDRCLGKDGDISTEDEATKLLKRLMLSGATIEEGGK